MGIAFAQGGLCADLLAVFESDPDFFAAVDCNMIHQTVPGIQLEFGYLIWKLFKGGKECFISKAGISWSSITKLSRGDTVSLEVLMKICKALECDIGDIVELIPTEVDYKGKSTDE